jgi:hypothetical protein
MGERLRFHAMSRYYKPHNENCWEVVYLPRGEYAEGPAEGPAEEGRKGRRRRPERDEGWPRRAPPAQAAHADACAPPGDLQTGGRGPEETAQRIVTQARGPRET